MSSTRFARGPLFFLSGALYPVSGPGTPAYVMVLQQMNPLTYAVDLLRFLLLGVGQTSPLVDAGVLAGFTLAMLAFGTFMFQRMK